MVMPYAQALIRSAPLVPTLAPGPGAPMNIVPSEAAAPSAGSVLTPEEIQNRRAYADLLLAQSTRDPVNSWTQGVGNMVKALVGGYAGRKADQADEAAKQAEIDKANAVSSEYGNAMAAYLTGNHDTSGMVNILRDPNAPIELKSTISSLLGEALKPQPLVEHDPTKDLYIGNQMVRPGTPKSPDQPSSYQEWQLAHAQGDPRDYPTFLNDKLTKMQPTLPASEQIKIAGATAGAKAKAESEVAKYDEINKTGQDASLLYDELQAMKQLSQDPNFYSGLGSGAVLFAKKGIAALGGDPNAAKPMETFAGLANAATLKSLGGKLGNQVSNTDRIFVQETMPALSASAAGNAMRVEIQSRIAQRNVEVAQMARDYLSNSNHPTLDSGFDDIVAKYAKAHPLFDEAFKANVTSQPGSSKPMRALSPDGKVYRWNQKGSSTDPTNWELDQDQTVPNG